VYGVPLTETRSCNSSSWDEKAEEDPIDGCSWIWSSAVGYAGRSVSSRC
jgi:hypothetical protein